MNAKLLLRTEVAAMQQKGMTHFSFIILIRYDIFLLHYSFLVDLVEIQTSSWPVEFDRVYRNSNTGDDKYCSVRLN